MTNYHIALEREGQKVIFTDASDPPRFPTQNIASLVNEALQLAKVGDRIVIYVVSTT